MPRLPVCEIQWRNGAHSDYLPQEKGSFRTLSVTPRLATLSLCGCNMTVDDVLLVIGHQEEHSAPPSTVVIGFINTN